MAGRDGVVLVQLSVRAVNVWLRNTQQHHQLMSVSCHVSDCKTLLVFSKCLRLTYSKLSVRTNAVMLENERLKVKLSEVNSTKSHLEHQLAVISVKPSKSAVTSTDGRVYYDSTYQVLHKIAREVCHLI